MYSKTLMSLGFSLLLMLEGVVSVDYATALDKSLLYFEAQRSGKLPLNQRVQWRGDSALTDGRDAGVNLTGGYYDAGDNVKFGFPMAFTVAMLSWSVAEYGRQLNATGQLSNALDAIKWGTDYFINAHQSPNVLYGEVGGGDSDHACWQRPEDMTTPRNSFKIDDQNHGSDLAGETAAALAAASVAFKKYKPSYSSKLISHADQLFEFATSHRGLYQNSIPAANNYYRSSGDEDELLWAAAWLHRATGAASYKDFIQNSNSGGTRSMFSWDDKYVGAQVLIAKAGTRRAYANQADMRVQAENYICNCIQRGTNNVPRTGEGLLWFNQFNNLQYVTTAVFAITTYSDYLRRTGRVISCVDGPATSRSLLSFVQTQVNYILGQNQKGMSYMVGYGSNYPQHVHHRGASIVSIKKDPTLVTCKGGFAWLNKNEQNPNVLQGAIVGGPDQGDNYIDSRTNFEQAEAATANVAPLVGVLARLA